MSELVFPLVSLIINSEVCGYTAAMSETSVISNNEPYILSKKFFELSLAIADADISSFLLA